MGILYQLIQILNGICCGGTRTKSRCTNIQRIGAMIDGLFAKRSILCRSQKFEPHNKLSFCKITHKRHKYFAVYVFICIFAHKTHTL